MTAQLFVAFMLAVVSFYVNQRIHRMTSIKIIMNSLFDVYGREESFDEFDAADAEKRLMDQIIVIEMMNDDNYYIEYHLQCLKDLRYIYHTFKDKESAYEKVKQIGFRKLNRSFVIMAFLDIEVQYLAKRTIK